MSANEAFRVSACSEPVQWLFGQALNWMDARWCEESGVLSGYPYRNTHIRGTVWYATGLLMRGADADIVRACQALNTVLSYQWTDSAKANFGDWARTPEEFCSQPEIPVEAKDFDPNWREFIACTLILLIRRYGGVLPDELGVAMHAAIQRAAEGSHRRHVWALYSNIAIMSAFLMDWAGAEYDVPAWREHASSLSAEIYEHFSQTNAFPEHNSPTYYGVDFFGLALMRTLGASPEIRQRGAAMEAALWRDVALFYHAGMKNLCGPWSRSYGCEMTRYCSLLGVWMALAVRRIEQIPLPDLASSFGHEHDIVMTPPILLAGTMIPPEVLPELVCFTGERTVKRLICSQPRRIVTAWLSERLMIGAESDAPDGSVYTDYRQPVTFHWRVGSVIAYGCMEVKMPLRAEAGRFTAQVNFCPKLDMPASARLATLRLSAPGLTAADICGTVWNLPALRVRIEGGLASPTVQQREGELFVEYTIPAVESRLILSFEPV